MEVIGQHHAPATLAPGMMVAVPLGRRLGVPKSQSGPYGDEKYLLNSKGYTL